MNRLLLLLLLSVEVAYSQGAAVQLKLKDSTGTPTISAGEVVIYSQGSLGLLLKTSSGVQRLDTSSSGLVGTDAVARDSITSHRSNLTMLFANYAIYGDTDGVHRTNINTLFTAKIATAESLAAHLAHVNKLYATKSDTGHTHTQAQVTGLVAALAAKSDTGHSQNIDKVTGLQDSLNLRSFVNHSHFQTYIVDLDDSLNARVRYSDTSAGPIATRAWVLAQNFGTGSEAGLADTTVVLKDMIADSTAYLRARLADSSATLRALVAAGGLSTGNLTEATSSVLTIGNGTNAVIGSGTTIQVLQAGSGQSGFLSSGDWATFNAKQGALTLGNLTEASSSVLTITGGTGAIVGSGLTLQVKLAGSGQSGYLSSADWNTFNNKAPTTNAAFSGTFTVPTGFSGTLRAASGVVSATPSDTAGLAALLAAKQDLSSIFHWLYTANQTDSLRFLAGTGIQFSQSGGNLTVTGTDTGSLSSRINSKLSSSDTAGLSSRIDQNAPIASPSFTGTVTLPTGLSGTLRAAAGVVSATPSDTTGLAALLAAKAPTANPTFSGVVKVLTDTVATLQDVRDMTGATDSSRAAFIADSLKGVAAVPADSVAQKRSIWWTGSGGVDSSLVTTSYLVPIMESPGIVIDSVRYWFFGGSSPVVTCQLSFGSDVTSGTRIDSTTCTSNTTATAVTSFEVSSISAGKLIWLHFPAVTTKPRTIYASIRWHKL